MDRPKIVVTSRVHEEVLRLLRSRCEVIANTEIDPWPCDHVLGQAHDAIGIIAFMSDCINRDFLSKCPRLRIVASVLKGCDNFDVDACTEQGVWFTVVPDRLTAATAELTIGLMIGVARHVVEADDYVRREYRGWRPIFLGQGLQNSTVGILGMGAIGRAVARRLQPFDCRVLYYDEKPVQAIADAQAVPLTSVLRESDFLIIALPLTVGTRHLINSRAIASMKPGAFLINTARGSIVDEEAVADALERKHLGGYAADVFEMEDWARPDRPRSISQRLLADRSRTVLTPHLGSAERRVRHAAEMEMAQSILDCLAGKRPRGAVNNPVTSYASVAC